MHPYLKESDKPSEEVVWLLNETILGSNGAKYRHCDTNRHIQTIDEPLYLTLQRHQRVLANVTFCRRNNDWYVRYFAFHASSQSSSPKPQKKGVLRLALKEYFELKLQDNSCRRFYAYIDPSNTKSKQMAESFGFEKKGEITTQTFSRVFPKNSPRLSKEPYSLEIQQLVFQHFGKLNYFFEAQLNHGKFYVIRNSEQKIIAFTNVHNGHWEWKQLPGKFGKYVVKLIPLIPLLNRIFNPRNHRFLVFDTVFIENNQASILEELLSACLFHEKRNSAFWWTDSKNQFYQKTKSSVKWGPLNFINGAHSVDLMVLGETLNPHKESYVNGLDFI